MYNSDIPTRDELPSPAQLFKSTVIAVMTAIVLLVTVVLPGDYAIDPTGVGRMLKLTQMGEIKVQLAAEAEADRIKDRELQQQQQQQPAPKPQSSLIERIGGLLVSSAQAEDRLHEAPLVLAQAAATRSDETVITLKPNEGVEWKLRMAKGQQTKYAWTVVGGAVNFDMHGTPWTRIEKSYKKGVGSAGDEGVLEAAFDGTHGWFFRNRGTAPVTITLKTDGAYTDLRRG
jgi:hypothetical protein